MPAEKMRQKNNGRISVIYFLKPALNSGLVFFNNHYITRQTIEKIKFSDFEIKKNCKTKDCPDLLLKKKFYTSIFNFLTYEYP